MVREDRRARDPAPRRTRSSRRLDRLVQEANNARAAATTSRWSPSGSAGTTEGAAGTTRGARGNRHGPPHGAAGAGHGRAKASACRRRLRLPPVRRRARQRVSAAARGGGEGDPDHACSRLALLAGAGVGRMGRHSQRLLRRPGRSRARDALPGRAVRAARRNRPLRARATSARCRCARSARRAPPPARPPAALARRRRPIWSDRAGAGAGTVTARNRELLGLFPVAVLITAGFTAVFMARQSDLGSATPHLRRRSSWRSASRFICSSARRSPTPTRTCSRWPRCWPRSAS